MPEIYHILHQGPGLQSSLKLRSTFTLRTIFAKHSLRFHIKADFNDGINKNSLISFNLHKTIHFN